MNTNINLKLKLKTSYQDYKYNDGRLKTQNTSNFQNKQSKIGHHKKISKIFLVSKRIKTQHTQLNNHNTTKDNNNLDQTKTKLKILPNDKKQLSNTIKIKLKSLKTEYNEPKQSILMQSYKHHKDYSLVNNKRQILSNHKSNKDKQLSYNKDSNTQKKKQEKYVQKEKKMCIKINLTRDRTSNLKNNLMDPQQRYKFQQKAGNGTFGIVHKARDNQTMQIVAIKRVYQDKNYKNRQLDIMKMLNHKNIIKMKDSYYTYQKQKEYLNIVMDYYPMNLSQYIYHENKKKDKDQMFWLKFKILSFQMLKALLYLKINKIVHRDLKPHNILINSNKFSLVICDFGSAKLVNPNQNNLAYICSRSYRAPQLIIGNRKYNTHVDMWSLGCIMVQMITGQILFKGKNNMDQLMQIIRIIGNPCNDQIKSMNPQCFAQKFKVPKIKGIGLQKYLQNYTKDPCLIDLLNKILVYDPNNRLNPFDGLQHQYFNVLKSQETYKRIVAELKTQKLFDFDWLDRYQQYNKQKLIPQWYNQ